MRTECRTIVCAIYVVFALSGCSVAMALSGHPEPNFKAFEVGSSQQQVEIQFGKPVSTRPLENGKREDTYRYEIGNAPNGHRALFNFYLDLATIALWEIPGTIIEASLGHKEETKIVYGPDNRVLEILGYVPPPPSPALKQAMEEQEKYARPALTQTESPAGPIDTK